MSDRTPSRADVESVLVGDVRAIRTREPYTLAIVDDGTESRLFRVWTEPGPDGDDALSYSYLGTVRN